MDRALSLSAGGVAEGVHSVLNCFKDKKQRVRPGNLQQFHNSRIDATQSHAVSSFVARDVSAHQRPKPGRIDVGDFAEIEYQGVGRLLTAHCILKNRRIACRQRTAQSEYLLEREGVRSVNH